MSAPDPLQPDVNPAIAALQTFAKRVKRRMAVTENKTTENTTIAQEASQTATTAQLTAEQVAAKLLALETWKTNTIILITALQDRLDTVDHEGDAVAVRVTTVESLVSTINRNLQNINSTIAQLQTTVNDHTTDIALIKSGVKTNKDDIAALKLTVSNLPTATTVTTLRNDLTALQDLVGKVQTTVATLRSDVDAIQQSNSNTDWFNMTLMNSFRAYSSSDVPMYRRRRDFAELYGSLAPRASGTYQICTLPVGFRPLRDYRTNVTYSYTSSGRTLCGVFFLEVLTTGAVYLYITATYTSVILDGVRFQLV